MSGLVPIAGHDLLFFLGASLAVLVTPGPAVLYITGISLDRGWRAGVLSVVGINAGFVAQLAVAVAGLSVVLESAPGALRAITLIGAGYLVYLGIARLRQAAVIDIPREARARAFTKIVLDGAVVSFLNPKSGLFLLAFLPQFVTPGAGAEWRQLLVLGLLFTFIGFFTDCAYALGAGAVKTLVAHKKSFRAVQRYVAGGIFIALGVVLAALEVF